jgi:hypothetical protein
MGVWFATIWILEYSTPFYAQFQQGLRDKIRHDTKNLGLAAINAGITVVFFGAILPAVKTCVNGHATGLL